MSSYSRPQQYADFKAAAKARHYKLHSPSSMESQRHVDLIMSGLGAQDTVVTRSLDIKSLGPKSNGVWHWIEFKNPNGKTGWLYEIADFIVFECKKDFVMVARKNLIHWINSSVKIRHDLPAVKNSWEAKYRLFSRKNKKECITQIHKNDLLQIPNTQIWKK